MAKKSRSTSSGSKNQKRSLIDAALWVLAVVLCYIALMSIALTHAFVSEALEHHYTNKRTDALIQRYQKEAGHAGSRY